MAPRTDVVALDETQGQENVTTDCSGSVGKLEFARTPLLGHE